MKKYVAEFIGTFTLVLFGCGTAVVSGQAVGHLGIAFRLRVCAPGNVLRYWSRLGMPR